jgi:group I intron endonuclease
MEKKFNFIYVTINLIDGKQYIGDHSTDDLNCYKTKHYLGSGLYFLRAIKEYGKENFKREILEFFPTKEEAFDAQERYIKEYNTLVPNGYNISPKGGNRVIGCCSNETKEKLKQKRIGKTFEEIFGEEKAKEIKEKMSINIKGKTKGRKQSEESIRKRALANTGKHRTEETKEKTRQSLLGIKHTDERRKNQSNAHKGKTFFAKNFGPIRYGKDNPSYKTVTQNELLLIIDLHINQHMSPKKIRKVLNNKFSPGKILKVLREEGVYIKSKYAR